MADVNRKKSVRSSMRDPLNPVYEFQKPNGEVYKYGEIEGNKPKVSIKDVS